MFLLVRQLNFGACTKIFEDIIYATVLNHSIGCTNFFTRTATHRLPELSIRDDVGIFPVAFTSLEPSSQLSVNHWLEKINIFIGLSYIRLSRPDSNFFAWKHDLDRGIYLNYFSQDNESWVNGTLCTRMRKWNSGILISASRPSLLFILLYCLWKCIWILYGAMECNLLRKAIECKKLQFLYCFLIGFTTLLLWRSLLLDFVFLIEETLQIV